MVLAGRTSGLLSPSASKLFEIFLSRRGALVFPIDIQYGLESLRRRMQEKKAHIDRLIDEDGPVLPRSLAVVHHKDAGSAHIKKMSVKRVHHFSPGLIPSPEIETLLPIIEVSG